MTSFVGTRTAYERASRVRAGGRFIGLRAAVVAAALLGPGGGCGSGGGGVGTPSSNPCQMLCEKQNACASPSAQPIPCAEVCVYGGDYYMGLAPTPYCPNLAAQTACVSAAVAMSCDAYQNAWVRCPTCPPLDGSPCSADIDCQKYSSNYRCDLSRPGGYCTAPCQTSDDCSISGPEVCATSAAPSFDPSAPASQAWCLLGCQSDANCRPGYACTNINASDGYGVCDAP